MLQHKWCSRNLFLLLLLLLLMLMLLLLLLSALTMAGKKANQAPPPLATSP